MNNLKKILFAVTAVMMIFAFAACGEEKTAQEPTVTTQDPMEIYLAALKKTAGLKDMDITMNMASTLETDGDSFKIAYDSKLKIKDTNQETMQMAMTTNTSVAGHSFDTNIYYTDGYYYMDTPGQAMKFSIDLQEVMKQVKNQTSAIFFEEDVIQSIEASEDGKMLTLKLDEAALSSFAEQIVASTLGDTGESDRISIGDIDCVFTLDDNGYIVAEVMDCTMNIAANALDEGDATEMEMDMHLEVQNNISEEITIDLPDFSEYEDMGAYSNLMDEAELE